ncbi:hypothetical protein CFU_4390 [Collimonas fungivorans Ter331]|uniref:Uncharacterized protein n=1 Tax=Collimonas fungivorans (strain Ter331) TaxID=1005048 RepID=G0AEK3_COLFT|nr:hypothetical protein CFU_4390 [Collimonas fungivorans Ter331]
MQQPDFHFAFSIFAGSRCLCFSAILVEDPGGVIKKQDDK